MFRRRTQGKSWGGLGQHAGDSWTPYVTLPNFFLQELWGKSPNATFLQSSNLTVFHFGSCQMRCFENTLLWLPERGDLGAGCPRCPGRQVRCLLLRGSREAARASLVSAHLLTGLHWREKLGKPVDSLPGFKAPWNFSFCLTSWYDAAKGSLGALAPNGQGSLVKQEVPPSAGSQ